MVRSIVVLLQTGFEYVLYRMANTQRYKR